MLNGEKIWIAQDGQRSGPFTQEDVRQGIAERRYGPDTLVWHKGLTEWVPLFSLFPENTVTPPAPPPPKATASAPAAVFTAHDRPGSTFNANDPAPVAASPGFGYASHADYASDRVDRRDLPTPPSLHWGLVFLFSILTLGIFAIIWPFIQANWVRKIDGDSKATMMLAGGLVCLVASEIVAPGNRQSVLGGLLTLAYYVLWITAYFSMADSIKRKLAEYSLPVEIGGVTLFFFNTFYLQAQLSWIARWQDTGSSNPKPPKAAFYFLLLVPVFVIAMLAAIAIPQYQNYVKRAHAMELQRGQ